MREKKKHIIEYELKKSFFSISLDILLPVIINKSDKINKNSLLYTVHQDLIKEIYRFKKSGEIKYPLGFYLCLAMGSEYNNLLSDKELLESTLLNLRTEEIWDNGNVSYEMAIFFSYTFMNELYKDIAIDTHLLSNSNDTKLHFKNLRKELLNM